MTGKVLRFKTPEKTSSGLQFLRIEDDEEMAAFSIQHENLTLRFSLDVNGCIGEENEPYLLDEDLQESSTRESFTPEEEEIFLKAVNEATPIAREQLLMWKDCSASEKLSLQITWTEDVLRWLTKQIRKELEEEHFDTQRVLTRVNEIDLLRGRVAGMKSALIYL